MEWDGQKVEGGVAKYFGDVVAKFHSFIPPVPTDTIKSLTESEFGEILRLTLHCICKVCKKLLSPI